MEYKVVDLRRDLGEGGELLTALAADGWRVVACSTGGSLFLTVILSRKPSRDEDLRTVDESHTTIIDLIIRDVAEIERNPLPDQPDDEMRVTAEELRVILEDRLA
jgi:hypothetical protein